MFRLLMDGIFMANAYLFRKPLPLLESSKIYGMCYPWDIGIRNLYMPHQRYLDHFERAGFEMIVRTGMPKEIYKQGGKVVISGINIKYLKSIRPFQIFKVITTPVYWRGNYLYVEYQMRTISDDILTAYCLQTYYFSKINCEKYGREVLGLEPPKNIPEHLASWIESNSHLRSKINKEEGQVVKNLKLN